MEIGFSSAYIALGSYLVVGSGYQLSRSRKYYGRYVIIFLAGVFGIIQYSSFLADFTSMNGGSLASVLSRWFFYYMFIPLQNCLFFEFCRTLIMDNANSGSAATAATNNVINVNDGNNNKNGRSIQSLPTQAKYAIYTIYVAYLYTFAIAIVTIAYCASYANWYNTLQNVYYSDDALMNMSVFLSLGVWAYELLIILVVALAYSQLRSCIGVLSGYIVFLIVVNIGRTLYATLAGTVTNFTAYLIQYVVEVLIGYIGLVYGLIVSPRYLPSQKKQQTAQLTNQQYFTYAPVPQQQYFASSPQPPQMFMTTAPGSSTQVNQQQYPIVQIPQQQLQQAGQYQQQQPIIVQLPIATQQQYPIVQLQQAPGGGYYTTGQQ